MILRWCLTVYKGEHSRLLLLQTFTILIRKQTEALITILHAPEALEVNLCTSSNAVISLLLITYRPNS